MQTLSLTPIDPDLRAVLASALSDQDGFAADFYQRLFMLAPAARTLFPADLRAQQDKLDRSLVMLIKCLDEPATLLDELRQLGARHVLYGVQPGHYLLAGQALTDTFGLRLGAAFTPSAQRQWQQLYGWIAATMLMGAQVQEHAAPAQ